MDAMLFKFVEWSLGKMTPKQLELLSLKIKGLEYRRYREDDSPKGENIPGVRYR
jgi:hypothetical protein